MISAVMIFLSIGILAGCAARFPGGATVSAPRAEDSARALLESSIEAHGGYLYDGPSEVRVSYEGKWRTLVKILQPALTDAGYRGTSDERLVFAEDRLEQLHSGKRGLKRVVRVPGEVEVYYNDEVDSVEKRQAAAAMVADSYTMFLAGPSFFKRRNAELTLLDTATLDGRSYARISARLTPGLGFSDEDDVVLWIDAETRRLDRVHFTLNGLRSTQGAHVDVALGEHREVGGYLWPTTFLERIRAPFRVKAHSWNVTDLEVDGPAGSVTDGAALVARGLSADGS